MSILTYTTVEAVRAVLGTSEEEIYDSEIDTPDRSTELDLMLAEISPLVAEQFSNISQMAPGDRTSQQALFLRVVSLYASYCVAMTILRAGSTFFARRITDGKAEQQRDENMLNDLRDGVYAGFIAIRRRLAVTLSSLNVGYTLSTFSPVAPVSNVGLSADPVTRES